jgi:Flp pilus assembly protein TadG
MRGDQLHCVTQWQSLRLKMPRRPELSGGVRNIGQADRGSLMEQTGSQRCEKRSRTLGLLSRFARSRKGVTAIEFGMVGIPFIGLVCAIFETAFVFFTQEAFDNAVNNVARQVLVNNFLSSSTQTMASFKTNTFCTGLPSIIDCSKVTLNIQAFDPKTTTFATVASSIGKSWYNNPSANVNLGQAGYIVLFQAFYPMPVYLSILVASGPTNNGATDLLGHSSNTVYANPATGGTGFVHAIFSTVVFRNEP